jgi:hypothetical protein
MRMRRWAPYVISCVGATTNARAVFSLRAFIVTVLFLLVTADSSIVQRASSACEVGFEDLACQNSPNTYYYDCECDEHGCSLPGPPERVCIISHCTKENFNYCPHEGQAAGWCLSFYFLGYNLCNCIDGCDS